jgi:hypothetical protein
MGAAAERTSPELAREWQDANRRYAAAAFLRGHGMGAERLNTQGGLGGAMTRALGASRLMFGDPTGAAELLVGPSLQQEARMALPGVHVAYLRRAIPALRALGAEGQRYAALLEGASGRGSAALALTDAVLRRRSPAYRAAVAQLEAVAARDGAQQGGQQDRLDVLPGLEDAALDEQGLRPVDVDAPAPDLDSVPAQDRELLERFGLTPVSAAQPAAPASDEELMRRFGLTPETEDL